MGIVIDVNEIPTEANLPRVNNCWHDARITNWTETENNKKNGRYVVLEYTITGGVNKGRTVKNFYNYIHETENVQRISREQLGLVARSTGVDRVEVPETMDSFLNKNIRIKTNHSPEKDWPDVKHVEPHKPPAGFDDLEESSSSAQSQQSAQKKSQPWP